MFLLLFLSDANNFIELGLPMVLSSEKSLSELVEKFRRLGTVSRSTSDGRKSTFLIDILILDR